MSGYRPLGRAPIDTPLRFPFDRVWQRWLSDLVNTLRSVKVHEVTIDPAAVAANSTSAQTFSVPGLATDAVVTVNKPSHTSGLGIVNQRVSAAGTLELTYQNTTGSSIDPPSETYKVLEVRA